MSITIEIKDWRVIWEIHIPKKANWIYEVTLKRIWKDRSLNQNRYYFGVVLKILSEELWYTSEECHEVFKDRLLTKTYHPNKNKRIKLKRVVSTADLTTIEFEAYLTKIKAFALQKLWILIPDPNNTEFYYNLT